MYLGPIPPPDLLAQYGNIAPDLPERIIGWTEQQSKHRQSLERMRTEGSEGRMNRGQWISAAVAFLSLVVAAIVGIYGNPWVAGVIAVVGVGGPTAAVALARVLQRP